MERSEPRVVSQPDQLAHDIEGVKELVPIGRTKIYEEIASGRLKSFKVGNRRLVLHASLVEWLKALQEGADPIEAA